MARRLRITIGTMSDWAPPRHESFRLVAARLGGRWEQGIAARLRREGYDAFMPRTDEEVDACKVWLAVEELGRSFPLVAFEVGDAHERERALLRAEGTKDADMLHVVLRGLRTAVTDPARPMERGRAQREWRNAVLRSHAEDAA